MKHPFAKYLLVVFPILMMTFNACNSTESTGNTSPINTSSVKEDKPVFSWKHYCNSRYGFCFEFPSGLVEDLPANADGIVASTKDSVFVIRAFANFNVLDQSVEQAYRERLLSGNFSDTANVKKQLEADSYMLSGAVKGGYYSVEKTIVRDGITTSCIVKFLQSTSATHLDIANHIIQSFTLEKAKEAAI